MTEATGGLLKVDPLFEPLVSMFLVMKLDVPGRHYLCETHPHIPFLLSSSHISPFLHCVHFRSSGSLFQPENCFKTFSCEPFAFRSNLSVTILISEGILIFSF